jgi:hypothetical protein
MEMIVGALMYILFCGTLSVIAAIDLQREYKVEPMVTLVCAAIFWSAVAVAAYSGAISDRDCSETVGRGSISCE